MNSRQHSGRCTGSGLIARRMAEWMGGARDEIFERFTLRRFAEGRLEKETFIIG